MDQADLAAHLVNAQASEQVELLERYPDLVDARLAHALKATYDDTWSSNPSVAADSAAVLKLVADRSTDPEVAALAAWTSAMAALDQEGRADIALELLGEAEVGFQTLDQPGIAAQTQVLKLYACAMLGRYDEAFECGLAAREVFLAAGDVVAAGKIEQNLGNIEYRRDRYREAESYYRSAQKRFEASDKQDELARVENNLGNVLWAQHRFREAQALYEGALRRVEQDGADDVTMADIECNLGYLALYEANYDHALDYLERSGRRFAALDMPHRSAITELDVASAYLELNLAPESASICERVARTFDELGMRAERARALAYLGQASLLLGNLSDARTSLAAARKLYAEEENLVGAANVRLTEAHVHYQEGEYAQAVDAAAEAEKSLVEAGATPRLLMARWLGGEARRSLREGEEVRGKLESTLAEAEQQGIPQVVQRCLTSLGLLASEAGDTAAAEGFFRRAVEVIDGLRAPLPAEEFRTAFISDKLTPYNELVRMCLLSGHSARAAEALGYVERARSRALLEMVAGVIRPGARPRDPFEEELVRKIDELRQELNWFYSQINRPGQGNASRGAVIAQDLQAAMREREDTLLGITRRLQHRGDGGLAQAPPLNLSDLQRHLGPDTTIVEYFRLDSRIGAFVITDEDVEVVYDLGSEAEVESAVRHLEFQMSALRHGSVNLRRYLPELATRADHYLGKLYDLLLAPLERLLADRRLVIVPYGVLHYVPFHALYNGERHLIDLREVSYAPSAAILQACLRQPVRTQERALLLGNTDAHAPRVRDEVLAVAGLFPESVTLLDEKCTLAALSQHSSEADVIHFACHGQFRPDNPLFSSVRLADSWLTVRDAYNLDLKCSLVVLSACETGINSVAPGDEIIGLARGFFSTGAPSLVVSLRTVDDESTAELMLRFYQCLEAGDRPAAALRQAQRDVKLRYPHPYYWSPFILLGRW